MVRPDLYLPVGRPFLFFFNDTATTEIYTLSLHDALPIFSGCDVARPVGASQEENDETRSRMYGDRPYESALDRKSTRLNSSHDQISYAVFCLKKKSRDARSRRDAANGGRLRPDDRDYCTP